MDITLQQMKRVVDERKLRRAVLCQYAARTWFIQIHDCAETLCWTLASSRNPNTPRLFVRVETAIEVLRDFGIDEFRVIWANPVNGGQN